MKKILLIVILTNLVNPIFAQSSNKAVQLLDQVRAKTNSYQDMEFNFTYDLDNYDENIHQSKKGIAYIKKDKFQLQIDDIKIIFDGKKRYSIIDDEVNISSAKDESGISSPTQILDMYKEGYVVKWDIEQKVPGKKIQFVKLVPIDSNSQYSYILIGIDIASKDLYNVIYTDKQGTQYKLQIKDFKTNTSLPNSLFVFNKKLYPEDKYIYTDLDE